MLYSKNLAISMLFFCHIVSSFADGAGIEWQLLTEQAMDFFRGGEHERAIAVAKNALAVAELEAGNDHPDVATSLSNLASFYMAAGQFALAEPLFDRALAIQETALRPDHPDVAVSLNNLA
jgi:tetratricopeptide (TPR) repeat protein